jgi:hypothetical protein
MLYQSNEFNPLLIKLVLQASGQLKEIEKHLKEQYKHTSKTLELLADLLADLRYRDGIEEIEASFTAFWKGIKQYCRYEASMFLNFNGNQTENDRFWQIAFIHSLSKVLKCEGKKLFYNNQFGYLKTKNITYPNLESGKKCS